MDKKSVKLVVWLVACILPSLFAAFVGGCLAASGQIIASVILCLSGITWLTLTSYALIFAAKKGSESGAEEIVQMVKERFDHKDK